MKIIFSLMVIFFLFPCLAWSEIIDIRDYGHRYNGANGIVEPTFVICDCPYSISLVLLERETSQKMEKSKSLLSSISIRVTEEGNKDSQNSGVLEERGAIIGTVFFSFNSSSLRRDAILELNRIVEVVKSRGFSDIIIEGYTCDIGAEEYNKRLSQRRADVIASYFRARNINISRVEGRGECCPISDIRKKNRRVEVLVEEK